MFGQSGSSFPAAPAGGLAGRLLLLLVVCLAGLFAVAVWLSWRLGMELTVRGPGVLEPRQREAVRASAAGILRRVEVRQGQPVEAGQLLVAMEDEEWRVQLRKLEADLADNRSGREQLAARIGREEAQRRTEAEAARLALEEACLRLEQERAEQALFDGALVLPAGRVRPPVDQLLPVRRLRTVVEERRADWRAAEERALGASERRRELEAIAQSRAKLIHERQWLRRRLDQAAVRAPRAGVVLTPDLEKRVGAWVQAGEVLLELADLGGWRARVAVQEIDLPHVVPGQAARLFVRAYPHLEFRAFAGRVERVPLAPAGPSGGYEVEVAIDDPEVGDAARTRSLACGMTAEVRIVVEQGRICAVAKRWLMRQLGVRAGRSLYAFRPAEAR